VFLQGHEFLSCPVVRLPDGMRRLSANLSNPSHHLRPPRWVGVVVYMYDTMFAGRCGGVLRNSEELPERFDDEWGFVTC
jgi:hypothetical protein